MHKYSFDHTQVSHVRVNTFQSAAMLSKVVPHRTDEAQYNIAFPVASALVHGDVGYAQVREEALNDPVVLNMMKRLEFVVDPKMDCQFPAKRLAWVEITLRDGRTCVSDVYEAPGEPDDPELNLEWIEKKFRRVTALMLPAEAQENLIRILTEELETPARELVAYLNASLRKSI